MDVHIDHQRGPLFGPNLVKQKVSKASEIIIVSLLKLQRMLLHLEKIHEICLAYRKVPHHKSNNFQSIFRYRTF